MKYNLELVKIFVVLIFELNFCEENGSKLIMHKDDLMDEELEEEQKYLKEIEKLDEDIETRKR